MEIPVTVVIPAYRRAHLLPRALRSVAAQVGLTPAEVIVVDDGSDDDTAAIAARMGARVIRHDTNLGPSAARNTGFAAAMTPWLMQLDSDDEWLPHCLGILWPLRSDHVLVSGACVGSGPDPWYNGVPSNHTRIITSPAELLFPDNFISASAVMLDTSAVRQVGGYRTDLRFAEDLELWLRLLEIGTGIATPAVVSRYHDHGSQATVARHMVHQGHADILELSVDRHWWTRPVAVKWSSIPAWDDLRRAIGARDVTAAASVGVRLVRNPRRLQGLIAVLRHRQINRRRLSRYLAAKASTRAFPAPLQAIGVAARRRLTRRRAKVR